MEKMDDDTIDNGKLIMDNDKNCQLLIVNSQLTADIRDIISQARLLTRRSVNSLQVVSNYLIGMRIVLEEQKGQERAEYGKETLQSLFNELTSEFGKGYSHRNLKYMRQFYLAYSSEIDEKSQTVSSSQEAQ